MSGSGEAVATCTGEQADQGPAPLSQQTDTIGQGHALPSIQWNSGTAVCSLDPDGDRELQERMRGGRWLVGHQHGGAGGLVDGTHETAD